MCIDFICAELVRDNMTMETSKRMYPPKKVLLIFAVMIALVISVAFLYSSPFLILTEQLKVSQFKKEWAGGAYGYSATAIDSGRK